jgi:transposase
VLLEYKVRVEGGLNLTYVVDKTTVVNLVKKLKDKFKINTCCIVLDRGMITEDNLDEIGGNFYSFIATLTRDEIRNLKEIPWEYLKTIDEDNVDKKKQEFEKYNERAYYRELKEEGNRRYILCFNPEKFLQERRDRCDKIKDIEEYISNKNKELLSSKKTRDKNKIERDIYYCLKKRKATKYFKDIECDENEKEIVKKYKVGLKKKVIKVYSIKYKLSQPAIDKEKLLDGVYVICSNFLGIDAEDLISGYRGRIKIERAFMQIKQFLEIRPIFHRIEERIRAHVFICVLAYLLNVLLEYKVRVEGGLNLTYEKIYEILENCHISEVEIKNIKEKRLKIQDADQKQIKILNVLGYEDLLEEKDKFMI